MASSTSSSFSIFPFSWHSIRQRSIFSLELRISAFFRDDNMFGWWKCKMTPERVLQGYRRTFPCLFFRLPPPATYRGLNFHHQVNDVSGKSFLSLHLRIIRIEWETFAPLISDDFLFLLVLMIMSSMLRLPQVAYPKDDNTNIEGRMGGSKMWKSITIIDSREMLQIVIFAGCCCHVLDPRCGLMEWGWCSVLSLSFEFYDAYTNLIFES